MKKIIVASDRAGFTLKEAVKEHLTELEYEVTDVGSKDTGDGGMAYWQAAKNLAPRVSSGEFERGILVCGTGMGMSIVANKYPNVYAALCENTFCAHNCRAVNNANVLAMGGWITPPYTGIAITDTFLNTEFLDGVTEWQTENLPIFLGEVKNIEKENFR
nr:RpiB/LacA/LacB family sugar-phosphate isomerase [uncultured Agathobaculum sp.]